MTPRLPLTILITILNFSFALSQTFTEVALPDLPIIVEGTVEWVDTDNDDDLDLFLTGYVNYVKPNETPIARLYINNGSGKLSVIPNLGVTGVWVSSSDWGDYDNDGDLDLILNGTNNGSIPVTKLYTNTGNNTFVELTTTPFIKSMSGYVKWGDYNNDGFIDLLVTGQNDNRVISKIYSNNKNGTFTESISNSIIGFMFNSAAWFDYDKDGDFDLLIIGTSTMGNDSDCKMYINTNGQLTESPPTGLQALGNGTSLSIGDYNKDGYPDVATLGRNSKTNTFETKVYKNLKDGTFIDAGFDLKGFRVGRIKWCDLNNDGNLDLICAGQTDTGDGSPETKIYLNELGKFTALNVNLEGGSLLAIGDYDKDGDLDIYLAGYLVNRLYKNDITVKNVPPSIPTNLNSIVTGRDVALTWNKSFDDKTATKSLTYSLRIGTTLTNNKVLSSPSNSETGFCKQVGIGSVGLDTSWTIKGLPNGVYYWSVQSVDNSFEGSLFSNPQSFQVNEIVTNLSMEGQERVDIGPNPANNFLYFPKKYSDSFVLLFDLMGNVVLGQELVNCVLDISNLNDGVYFLQIIRENRLDAIKLTKLR